MKKTLENAIKAFLEIAESVELSSDCIERGYVKEGIARDIEVLKAACTLIESQNLVISFKDEAGVVSHCVGVYPEGLALTSLSVKLGFSRG